MAVTPGNAVHCMSARRWVVIRGLSFAAIGFLAYYTITYIGAFYKSPSSSHLQARDFKYKSTPRNIRGKAFDKERFWQMELRKKMDKLKYSTKRKEVNAKPPHSDRMQSKSSFSRGPGGNIIDTEANKFHRVVSSKRKIDISERTTTLKPKDRTTIGAIGGSNTIRLSSIYRPVVPTTIDPRIRGQLINNKPNSGIKETTVVGRNPHAPPTITTSLPSIQKQASGPKLSELSIFEQSEKRSGQSTALKNFDRIEKIEHLGPKGIVRGPIEPTHSDTNPSVKLAEVKIPTTIWDPPNINKLGNEVSTRIKGHFNKTKVSRSAISGMPRVSMGTEKLQGNIQKLKVKEKALSLGTEKLQGYIQKEKVKEKTLTPDSQESRLQARGSEGSLVSKDLQKSVGPQLPDPVLQEMHKHTSASKEYLPPKIDSNKYSTREMKRKRGARRHDNLGVGVVRKGQGESSTNKTLAIPSVSMKFPLPEKNKQPSIKGGGERNKNRDEIYPDGMKDTTKIVWSQLLHFVSKSNPEDCDKSFVSPNGVHAQLSEQYNNSLVKFFAELRKWEKFSYTNALVPPSKTKQVLAFHDLAKQSFVKTICEIGFGSGFNTLAWLTAKPDLKVYSFDGGKGKFTKPLARYLKVIFPKRLHMYYGQINATVKRWASLGRRCDIVTADGGLMSDVLLAGLHNIRSAISPTHILIMDNMPHAEGRDRVWRTLIRKREIQEQFWCRKLAGSNELYNFGIGHYVNPSA